MSEEKTAFTVFGFPGGITLPFPGYVIFGYAVGGEVLSVPPQTSFIMFEVKTVWDHQDRYNLTQTVRLRINTQQAAYKIDDFKE